MKNPNVALDVELLTVCYDKTPVLWDISLSVPKGELVGIIGPNGAGKSTLIKVLLGLLKPISGTLSFFGKSLHEVQEKIAYIPQKETVDWDFPITVEELVLMGRYGQLGLFKRPRKADYEAVAHYLDLVGLTAFKTRQINQLSGGQQQRAFLARALIQEADIYFLDEPFTGVDAGTELMMTELLKNLVRGGKTVFVVHHDLNTVETLFSFVILLNLRLIAAGKTALTFTPDHLKLTYGKSYALLDEAAKINREKKEGIFRA
jgi:manganese/zinc/iron transport system ATP- binding protein